MRYMIAAILLIAPVAWGQTTQPSAQQVLDQMLKPTSGDKSTEIPPQTDASNTSQTTTDTPTVGILREGTDLMDRVGRLQKTPDGQNQQFVFDSDGRAMRDPPVIILPNLKLMSMETAVANASHDLRFRITGTITEYRGHNYILLEKVVVVQDKDQEF